MVTLAVAVVGVVAGVSAAVQNYRGAERSTPRVLPSALFALGALCLGAVLVAAIPQGGANAGVSAEMLSRLPALSVASSAYDQQEIHAKVGETIALRLDNRDSEAHSFDIDELNVHAPMPARQSGLALFKPSKPGTYTFYCGIPAHRNLADRLTLQRIVAMDNRVNDRFTQRLKRILGQIDPFKTNDLRADGQVLADKLGGLVHKFNQCAADDPTILIFSNAESVGEPHTDTFTLGDTELRPISGLDWSRQARITGLYRWLTSHRRSHQAVAIIKRANGNVRVAARGISSSHSSIRNKLSATAVITFCR